MKVKAVQKKPAPVEAEQVIVAVKFNVIKTERPPLDIEIDYERASRLTPVENPDPFITQSPFGRRTRTGGFYHTL